MRVRRRTEVRQRGAPKYGGAARARARLARWPARRRDVVTQLIQLSLFEQEKLQKFE
jgi:hypothetical protein